MHALLHKHDAVKGPSASWPRAGNIHATSRAACVVWGTSKMEVAQCVIKSLVILEYNAQAANDPEGKAQQPGSVLPDTMTAGACLSRAHASVMSAPASKHVRAQAQMSQPATAIPVQGTHHRTPLTTSNSMQHQLCETEMLTSGKHVLSASLPQLRGVWNQPHPEVGMLESDAARGQSTPAALGHCAPSAQAIADFGQHTPQQQQQQQQVEHSTPLSRQNACQKPSILSGLSRGQAPQCTPRAPGQLFSYSSVHHLLAQGHPCKHTDAEN